MAGSYTDGERQVRMNNLRFSSIFDFMLEVGGATAATTEEQAMVARMRDLPGQHYSHLDVRKDLPSLEEKKFWCRVMYDVARNIFLRRLGNQDIDFWQASAIHDAVACARLIHDVIDEVEPRWSCPSEDARLHAAWRPQETREAGAAGPLRLGTLSAMDPAPKSGRSLALRPR